MQIKTETTIIVKLIERRKNKKENTKKKEKKIGQTNCMCVCLCYWASCFHHDCRWQIKKNQLSNCHYLNCTLWNFCYINSYSVYKFWRIHPSHDAKSFQLINIYHTIKSIDIHIWIRGRHKKKKTKCFTICYFWVIMQRGAVHKNHDYVLVYLTLSQCVARTRDNSVLIFPSQANQ